MSGENTGIIDNPLFATYSGDTMDKVADIMGMCRKPGESDEELRTRVTEEMQRLDSLSFNTGYPHDLFPLQATKKFEEFKG